MFHHLKSVLDDNTVAVSSGSPLTMYKTGERECVSSSPGGVCEKVKART